MGHFDEVIASIDTMLQTLKDEEGEDIKQRDWCIEERHTEHSNRDDLEYDISQLQAKIERAESKKKGLEANVEETEKAKEDLEDDMAQALEDRTAENQNFHDAKEDDLKAIDLLGDAIAAMSSYSENNLALLQNKQPVFEVSEDQAPDATFSDSDKHSGASDGIVALLTHIKETLENEVGLATKSEAKATEEYDALKASADAQIEAYDSQMVDLRASIADTDAEIEADTNTKTDTTGEHTATLEYLEKIKPNCDWIEGAFTKRAEARKKESEGLQQAKAILAGAEGGDFGFLQRVK
jgi:DNA repair exonuclease SbcCD ATPase subunit